ncbi:hypothetical protein F8388_023893 [Cannabis sativa]|uniref:RRM domain-containing protein n=1 Tax=Cannabis sativa TaxID=3483 RepID=A0A7J6EUG2_CANSA|nr:hypothetical protein F8388_023893 [Cannabis sativa]
MGSELDQYENGAAMVDLPTGPNYSASGRKLFVGGVSWSTSKVLLPVGEITDSVIILNKHSGNPRGFGFVTFANPTDADKVIEQDHVIDGKKVDVKRTVPKDSMKAPSDKKMILLVDYRCYDDIVRTQIIRCPKSGRSRGFGFVTFSSEDAVEKILKEDTVHVLGGKKVRFCGTKKFNPESAGNNYSNNAATTKSNEASAAGAGHEGSHYGDQYNGKMEQVYWDHEAYCNYGASYYGNYPGFYGFYGAYLYGPPAYIHIRLCMSMLMVLIIVPCTVVMVVALLVMAAVICLAFSSQASNASSQDKLPANVGFLGIGIMGSPMAQNLIKSGYKSSPEEVAASCDVTFAMLSDPESAVDVACGKHGAVSGMSSGKGYVDVSTVDGETSNILAPVSGSKKPAEDGQLIFLTAGDKSLYETVAPFLDIMGKSRFYLGDIGNGAAMKLVVNMIMGSMMASFSEGLLLSEKVGLDPSVLVEVISQGAISAPMYSMKGPSMIQSLYPTAFPLKHQQKDMRLALGLAESVSQSTPIAAAANEMYKVAKSHGLSDQDFSAVIEALKGKLQQRDSVNGELKLILKDLFFPVPSPLSDSASRVVEDRDKSALKLGFLGIGIMGFPMAQNLIKAGYNVTVWNRTKSKCDPLISLGAIYKSTPGEVAASCDVTFAMLSDPQSAVEVACGKNGAASGLSSGKGYVDVSTVDGETSQLISQHIKATGALFLEAPVSGSKKPAEDGQLIFLAAGDKSLYDSVAPYLDIMGKSKFYLGDVGNGAAMKLVVNMVMGSMMASFSEGLLLSEKVGLDPNVLIKVISQGAISAPMYSMKGPSMIQSVYPTAFPLKHQQKDMRLALGLAESVSQSTPIAAAANELYKVAKSQGLSDQDFSAVIESLKGKLQQ